MGVKPLEIRYILSKNLKNQRKKLGISQEKLAEMTSLSVQTINDIEGCRKWVSDKTITKLSIALNIESYQLLIPNFFSRNENESTPTQRLLEIRNKVQKTINLQIEAQFDDFLKSGIFP